MVLWVARRCVVRLLHMSFCMDPPRNIFKSLTTIPACAFSSCHILSALLPGQGEEIKLIQEWGTSSPHYQEPWNATGIQRSALGVQLQSFNHSVFSTARRTRNGYLPFRLTKHSKYTGNIKLCQSSILKKLKSDPIKMVQEAVKTCGPQ